MTPSKSHGWACADNAGIILRLLRELGIIRELSAVFGIVPRFLSLGTRFERQ